MIMSFILFSCMFFVFLCSIAIRKNYTSLLSYFMMILSLLGMFFVLEPEVTTVVAKTVGIGRGTDLLLYFFVIINFLLLLLIHAKFSRYDVIITELVRLQSSILINTKYSKDI